MLLIIQDAHCLTSPRMGSLAASLALCRRLWELCSCKTSGRPLDALGPASGTEKYNIVRERLYHSAQGSHTNTLRAAQKAARPRTLSRRNSIAEVASAVCLGSRWRPDWQVLEKHFSVITLNAQDRKGLSDHLVGAQIFLAVSSCFRMDTLPVPSAGQFTNCTINDSVPVATTPGSAVCQAIFHPLTQQHCPLNEHEQFSLLIFNETQADPLRWTTTHPGTRGRKPMSSPI